MTNFEIPIYGELPFYLIPLIIEYAGRNLVKILKTGSR
jgi:hypothetical protein